MSHIKDIQYELCIWLNYDIVSKYLSLLPAKTKYTLSMDNSDLNTDPDLNEKLRIINWNDKRINSICWWEIQQLNIFNIIG